MSKPRIVITLGDPAGIGPEVVLRALTRPDLRKLADYLILGGDAVCRAVRERLSIPLSWSTVTSPAFRENELLLLEPAGWAGLNPAPGRWSEATGVSSLNAVLDAVRLCREGQADAMVTGPICKAAWKKAGCPYPGHTELLAEQTGCDREVMMLMGGGLRVALATVHEAIVHVPSLLSVERICGVARVLDEGLRRDFGLARPRIAVLGLNPHAGEEGHMGSEEQLIITPAVRQLVKEGIGAVGPLPADTVFFHALKGTYDAVLAMYHDQGLGPLKTVAFDSGVNVTLGLPIIRTSVDHGTAFDIAGQGKASDASCAEAIRTAVQMAAHRFRPRG